jgi:hypothetical protein
MRFAVATLSETGCLLGSRSLLTESLSRTTIRHLQESIKEGEWDGDLGPVASRKSTDLLVMKSRSCGFEAEIWDRKVLIARGMLLRKSSPHVEKTACRLFAAKVACVDIQEVLSLGCKMTLFGSRPVLWLTPSWRSGFLSESFDSASNLMTNLAGAWLETLDTLIQGGN